MTQTYSFQISSTAYSTGRTSSLTHDPLFLVVELDIFWEGVKVGVSSSLLALTGLPLIGDAESSESTAGHCFTDVLVLGGFCEDYISLNSPFWGLMRCFSAMCGVSSFGYNSIPTTRRVGGGPNFFSVCFGWE